jgi:DNA-binding transcriptional MerR regulator
MSPAVSDRAFLSIGEVLDLLKSEFPDVTISKIRFLESQGLIDPERTPSGYRKFYEADVERLRWILRQQREHFLPLKVIKDRLGAEGDLVVTEEPEPVVVDDGGATAPLEEPPPDEAPPARPGVPAARESLASSMTATTFTADELMRATNLGASELSDLERFGLVTARRVGSQVYFDEDALAVARLAAGFARHGVEARHLRMYVTSAAREAGFFEQVVVPLLKQRNPAARRTAVDTLSDMVKLGEGLRSALLRSALREHMGTT